MNESNWRLRFEPSFLQQAARGPRRRFRRLVGQGGERGGGQVADGTWSFLAEVALGLDELVRKETESPGLVFHRVHLNVPVSHQS